MRQVYESDKVIKGKQTVVQVQYKFPKTVTSGNTVTTVNEYRYQTYVLSIDTYTKNVGTGNSQLKAFIKEIYGTNVTNFENNADGIAARLLYPLAANITYMYTDLSDTQCVNNTNDFMDSTGTYLYCENVELNNTLFEKINLSNRQCQSVVATQEAWNTSSVDLFSVANVISTRWVNIFTRSGNIYQADAISFIVTLNKGAFALDQHKVCWSIKQHLQNISSFNNLTLNRYQVLQSSGVIPDFRVICKNPAPTNTQYRCIDQGNNQSIKALTIQVNTTNTTNTTNTSFPNNIRELSIYIGWQGTDSNGQALTSERNSFFYLNSYTSAL